MTNLNPIHECNAREVEMMVGKAMCAYANWQDALKRVWADHNSGNDEYTANYLHSAAHRSEYEATVRCIEMFVKDSIYAIQHHVVSRAEAELL